MEIKVSIYLNKQRGSYFLQYRDPVSGDKVRKSAKTRSEANARKQAGQWQEELNTKGDTRKDGRICWEDFRDRFETEYCGGLADATYARYLTVLNCLELAVKPQRLSSVTTNAIAEYQVWLRKNDRSESTIATHMRHLKAALNWAVDVGMLRESPRIRKPQRARKAARVMKGRPITEREYKRMVEATHDTVTSGNVKEDDKNEIAESWEYLLEGLWWSGLRLAEIVDLHWTDRAHICVEGLESEAPMFWIPDYAHKSNTDELLPMAPEFAEMLRKVSPRRRTGFVFNPVRRRQRNGERLPAEYVGKVISRIGKAAGVVVRDDRGKEKHASAHDLRRSFGDRWSLRVTPAVLKLMMRHESIQTTMKFYVGRDSEQTAAVIWQAYGSVGNRVGNRGS